MNLQIFPKGKIKCSFINYFLKEARKNQSPQKNSKSGSESVSSRSLQNLEIDKKNIRNEDEEKLVSIKDYYDEKFEESFVELRMRTVKKGTQKIAKIFFREKSIIHHFHVLF